MGPERVINEVIRQYKVVRDEIYRGTRGRENEARKVALYLVKRCSDRTMTEVVEYFGIEQLFDSELELSWDSDTDD